MKVFISWSGDVSRQVAVVLRDWLPSVIQSVEPYVSSEDIDKGARWSTDIAGELHASTYGIICLTSENITAPWINFEAGALGKSIDKSKVSPFLFRIKRSEVHGPILQFQSTTFEKPDVLKLLKSINSSCGNDALDETRLEKTFEVWWPQLEQNLNAISENKEKSVPASVKKNEDSKIIEEILELTRSNHRLLRDPMSIMPPDYIQQVMGSVGENKFDDFRIRGNIFAIQDLIEGYSLVLDKLRHAKSSHVSRDEVVIMLESIDKPIRYLSKKFGSKLPRLPREEEDLPF